MPLPKLSRALAVAALVPSLLCATSITPAEAGFVGTDTVIEKYSVEAERQKIADIFSRADVKAEFEKLGISADEAQNRLNSMSDAEVKKLAAEIDRAPAGQGSLGAIVGAAVFVFLVLLVTDLLCLTDVFPFTHCARK